MKIIETDSENNSALKAFKLIEWPEADKEHYGDNLPDFTKHAGTLIADEAGEIQGYISYSAVAGVGKIESIIVGKKFRGRGVAKRLLETVEQKMKTVGVHKVMLETGANWQAKKVYEKQGYQVRVVLPDDCGHQDFVLMDKML